MNSKKAIWIGVTIAVAGVALLIFLPKITEAKNAPPNPFGNGEDSPFAPSGGNQNSSSNKGCGGGYSLTGFPLKKGSCGSQVAKLQAFLNSEGGYGLAVDGRFGQLTQSAVKDQQSPFADFLSMYQNAVYGQINQEYYNDFIA